MKVEVTEGMLKAREQEAWRLGTPTTLFLAMLAHPDCQRQLRDMVLAAVPSTPEHS